MIQERKISEEERLKWERQWTDNMVVYWRERIDKLRVNDTGAMRSSIKGVLLPSPKTTIEHSFLLYGLCVSEGVGREFGKGYTDSLGRHFGSSRGGEGTWASGQLPFLLPGGEEYREEHGLDEPKKVGPRWGGRVAGGHQRPKKEWFYK